MAPPALQWCPDWTPEHRRAIDLFADKRNLFVTGSAGTGKTLLLNHLISLAGTVGVHCTALTGLAALNIRGTTLHKFAGCGLARGDADYLFRNMSYCTKGRWRSARVLFIDEVSMLDADFFEKLDRLARRVRMSPHELFGGIQLVMVGDFFQLPPVGQVAMDGSGGQKRMLFESPAFRDDGVCKILPHEDCAPDNLALVGDPLHRDRKADLKPVTVRMLLAAINAWCLKPFEETTNYHHFIDYHGQAPCMEAIEMVKLTKVFRQKEPELVGLLEAVRLGRVERRHLDVLDALQRPLDADDIRPTKLYPLNSMVDAENARRLAGEECSGPPVTYEALDAGKQPDLKYLIKNCPAAEILVLRVGAQVIHTVNHPSHPDVVNGSRGVVTGFTPDGLPRVKYAACSMDVVTHRWDHCPSPHSTAVTASRTQLPLRLGWSISIHRSQGMSIDFLEVFLDKIFGDGMAYVALSRSTSLAGLRVHSSHVLLERLTANPAVVAFDESM
ncbi:hypothetical protein WJX74_001919 [Apatococcus lobatus]|uniref:ATP-dependent DNA helicase n=1 Tax=Apatococcus lobatus TaxID=904363 RepID=A0AAW1QZN1_9CHLO